MKMKKGVLILGLFTLFLSGTAAAQTAPTPEVAPVQEAAASAETKPVRKVKPLPTCIDFTDVYSRVVLGIAEPTDADKEEMVSLAAIMMGYVSAMQDIFGGYLVGMSSKDTEWTLLESVNKFCLEYPQLPFQRAVRSIPAITQTMQALQDQEFARCRNFIEQTKMSICMPVCNEQKK